MKHIWTSVLMVSLGALVGGCADGEPETTEPVSVGRLAIVMVPFEGTDVVAIKVKVVPGTSDCTGAPVEEKIGLIRPDVTLAPRHPVADTFFALPVGSYHICVTPLSHVDPITPSQICRPTEGAATVIAELTTEIFLVSQCAGAPAGGLDVVASLNRPPLITDLNVLPSKLVLHDHDVEIAVTATDPDNDFSLSFSFTQVDGPEMATITPHGSSATFRASAGGTYQIRVVVTDGKGGQAALTFPIHVAGAS
jgi:hypothetical protein